MTGETGTNNFLKVSALLIALLALALSGAPAALAQDWFNVTVNISAVSQITVIPTSLAWTQVSPGTNGVIKNVTIKNTGSLNISTLEVTTNTIALEASNPLGTGDVAKYSATGFLVVANSSNNYYHLGRLEWNLSSRLASEVLPTGLHPTNWSHGWYRNSTDSSATGKNEYLWYLNGTDTGCNATGTIFKIKTAPENATAMKRDLTTEITSGDVCGGAFTAGGGKAWGVFQCTGATNPLRGHFVAAYYDCTKIYIYQYDKSNSRFPTVSAVPYLWNNVVTPGDETYMEVRPAVPLGTPAGDAIEGTVTLIAA